MKELSKLAQAVQASTTLAIDAMAKQMKADGIDVVGFVQVSLISTPRSISSRLPSTPSMIILPSIPPPPASALEGSGVPAHEGGLRPGL